MSVPREPAQLAEPTHLYSLILMKEESALLDTGEADPRQQTIAGCVHKHRLRRKRFAHGPFAGAQDDGMMRISPGSRLRPATVFVHSSQSVL